MNFYEEIHQHLDCPKQEWATFKRDLALKHKFCFLITQEFSSSWAKANLEVIYNGKQKK